MSSESHRQLYGSCDNSLFTSQKQGYAGNVHYKPVDTQVVKNNNNHTALTIRYIRFTATAVNRNCCCKLPSGLSYINHTAGAVKSSKINKTMSVTIYKCQSQVTKTKVVMFLLYCFVLSIILFYFFSPGPLSFITLSSLHCTVCFLPVCFSMLYEL